MKHDFRLNPFAASGGRRSGTAVGSAIAAALLAVGLPVSAQTAASDLPVTSQQRSTAQRAADAGVPLAELAPNAPDSYTVRRGDTLWGISGMFLRRPWRWPELWGMNLDQIRNPHLIYPGQALYLDKSDGRARLRMGSRQSMGADTVRLSPRVRPSPIDNGAIASIPFNLIEPFLTEAVIFEDDTINSAPRIVAAQEGRVLLSRGDTAYVRGELGSDTVFRIFRGARALRDPVSGEVLGYEAPYVGAAEYLRQGDERSGPDGKPEVVPATFVVTTIRQEANIGDRLAPVVAQEYLNYAPHAPAAPMAGQIVSIYGDALTAGQNQIVALNRGTRDGVERGHVLALVRDGSRTVDSTDPRRTLLKLPDERHGMLFVFRVFNRMSYALILSVKDPVKPGDKFTQLETPARAVIERDELAAWLRLLETPGVGRESARKLLAAFGSADAALAASSAARRSVVGLAAATALATPPETLDALVDATLHWLADAGAVAGAAVGGAAGTTESPRTLVLIGDPRYPAALLNTADPPLLLYAHGRVELLAAESLAIVGSRNPTPQGADNARRFARELSLGGYVIVSGLALGIDGAAHQGALDGLAQGGASSIAVVGTGLDRVYPKRHLALAHRLAREGLVISEFAIGTPALPPHFPLRNRIIAGLSRGTLVVEAALKSGSLITARLASEAGREVFAIPGSIHSPQSRGCHALIRQGAQLVDSVQAIVDELRPAAARAATTADSTADADAADAHADAPPAHPLLLALGHEPVTLDALVARTGWSAAELSIRLLDLELEGAVMRLPGQLFQRLVKA